MAADYFRATKYSLQSAINSGYEFEFFADGDATVTNPQGKQYSISGFRCDCPASTYNSKPCKHSHWIGQVFPCPECERKMLLTQVKVAGTTEERYQFQCANRHVLSWDEVKEIRASGHTFEE